MLPVGRRAAVRVPATSANLGPGFDSLGLALNWSDRFEATVTAGGFTFDLSGDGTESLPRTADHLVIRTLLETLEELGTAVSGLHLRAHSTIPLARGLGSSSAAIVAGLLLAWELANPGVSWDTDWAFSRACALEGHGDNVGPAILGDFTIAWTGTGGAKPSLFRSKVHDDVRALVLVPSGELLTDSARAALPSAVPLADAIANTASSALLVHAMAEDPSLFFEATTDRLHQPYRASLYPHSHALLTALRERGYGAAISGAGPTVLVLHAQEQSDDLMRVADDAPLVAGWAAHLLRPGRGAHVVDG